MSFEVNSSNSSINSRRSLRRVNNLQANAVIGFSEGYRTVAFADAENNAGVSEKLHKAPSEWNRNIPSKSGSISPKIAVQLPDLIIFSASGWSRVRNRLDDSDNALADNLESGANIFNLAKRSIIENPASALLAQANQTPESVIKLLE